MWENGRRMDWLVLRRVEFQNSGRSHQSILFQNFNKQHQKLLNFVFIPFQTLKNIIYGPLHI